jgi:purine-binding chemotaxis protein CheW
MGEYLTFTLAGDTYAFDIRNVECVLEYAKPNKLPNADPDMAGIINFRGSAIPVVDLRIKFGFGREGGESASHTIVLSVPTGGDNLVIGAVADSVKEVVRLDEATIEAPPTVGTSKTAESAFMTGIARKEDGFIILLDERVLFIAETAAAL